MISLYSYLLTFMAIIFWGFRVVTVIMFQMDKEFICQPLNVNLEIALLFLTIPALICVVKRNLIGTSLYLILYCLYFGESLINFYINTGVDEININSSMDVLFTVLGVVLPLLTFIDVLLNKNRGLGKGGKKTDWFYANEDYDRKFDERADRNQYKF